MHVYYINYKKIIDLFMWSGFKDLLRNNNLFNAKLMDYILNCVYESFRMNQYFSEIKIKIYRFSIEEKFLRWI